MVHPNGGLNLKRQLKQSWRWGLRRKLFLRWIFWVMWWRRLIAVDVLRVFWIPGGFWEIWKDRLMRFRLRCNVNLLLLILLLILILINNEVSCQWLHRYLLPESTESKSEMALHFDILWMKPSSPDHDVERFAWSCPPFLLQVLEPPSWPHPN